MVVITGKSPGKGADIKQQEGQIKDER